VIWLRVTVTEKNKSQNTINQIVIYIQFVKEYLTQTAFMILRIEFQMPAITYIKFYSHQMSELTLKSPN